jgi:S1-C subfamily serine protease
MSKQSNAGLLQSLSDAVAELAERVSPSVVSLGNGNRQGTGIVWGREGHIITADHVVGRASSLEASLHNGKTLEAKVVGRDPDNDLALLKVESADLVPIEAVNGRALRAGELVFAFANMTGSNPSVTSGVITSPSRSIQGWWGVTLDDAVITDAQLNPGYSGGPLVDASGRLVGMNVACFSSRGVAVSAGTLKERVQRLVADGRIRRGYLGIVAEAVALPPEIASRPDVGQETALLIRSVEAGTPAKAAGLTIGDVLVKMAGKPLTEVSELHRMLSEQVIDKTIQLTVLRGEKATELSVKPREAEE